MKKKERMIMNNVDANSKKFFFNWLVTEREFNNLFDTDDVSQYEHWDCDATWKNGKKFRFELKKREMSSDRYKDAIVEPVKYNELKKHRNEVRAIYIVNFFDDCYTVSNFDKEHREINVKAPKTSCFGNNEYVDKTFISWKQDIKFKYPEGFNVKTLETANYKLDKDR